MFFPYIHDAINLQNGFLIAFKFVLNPSSLLPDPSPFSADNSSKECHLSLNSIPAVPVTFGVYALKIDSAFHYALFFKSIPCPA